MHYELSALDVVYLIFISLPIIIFLFSLWNGGESVFFNMLKFYKALLLQSELQRKTVIDILLPWMHLHLCKDQMIIT